MFSKEFPRRQQIDEQEHQKRAKMQQNGTLVIDKGSLEKDQKAQLYHVPIVASLVLQNIQRPGDVAVAVVATDIVHAPAVDFIGLLDCLVPSMRTTHQFSNVHFEISGWRAKGHAGEWGRAVGIDIIGSTEIMSLSRTVGNSQVTDKGQYRRYWVEW